MLYSSSSIAVQSPDDATVLQSAPALHQGGLAGRVASEPHEGYVSVLYPDGRLVRCRYLMPVAPSNALVVGTEVFVCELNGCAEPVVVGVLCPVGPSSPAPAIEAHIPAEVVVEARGAITLRVADSSITLRKDGKILIKGTDVVSSAKRMNRVKGGAVAIN